MRDLKARYRSALEESFRHLTVLERDFRHLAARLPLTTEKVKALTASEEGLWLLDQIAYRYAKLQDTLGRLLRWFLACQGEAVEHLTMLDVVNLAEKLGFDLTEEDWMQLRGLRNVIAHEYPDSAHEIAQAVNELYRWLPKVKGWLERMQV